jgi:hypothetical protein
MARCDFQYCPDCGEKLVNEVTETRARCIVHGCENHKHQGRFVGDLCAPCHESITTGHIGLTTSFLGRLDKALDDLVVISVADWKTAGELRKMARDAYSSATSSRS